VKKQDEKRRRPGLQRGFESLVREDDTAKVAQVIKRLTGRKEPISAPPEAPSVPSPAPPIEEPSPTKRGQAKLTSVEDTAVESTPVKITSVTIEARYYKVPNDVSDVLASLQTPAEQAIYHRLFRLSYGYNKNVCRVGMQALSKATNIASKKTIAKAIARLIKKAHIAIVQEAHNDVRGTWYRVFLPDEIEEAKKLAGLKITAVKSTPVINSTVDFAKGEEKSSAVENTTVLPRVEIPKLEPSRVKNTTVDSTPYITNTLQTLSLPTIIDRFYQLLRQKPSKRKREKGIQEGKKLLQEGFTLEDLDYTVSWVTRTYPDTGSFDRIPFFIDQALKDRNVKQRAIELEHRRQAQEKQQRLEQRQLEEKRQRIKAVKASLSPDELARLQQEASRLIEEEQGPVTLGQKILIRLKMDELIRTRYLGEGGTE
jgi:hypothetical protein